MTLLHDWESPKQYEQAVLQDIAEAQRLGIQGVPYYIVDGRKANGVQSYEALEKLLQGNDSNDINDQGKLKL